MQSPANLTATEIVVSPAKVFGGKFKTGSQFCQCGGQAKMY